MTRKRVKTKPTKNKFKPWGKIYSYDDYIHSVKRLLLESPEEDTKKPE
jgi:hypothetical protein